jgi:hypothetical protein
MAGAIVGDNVVGNSVLLLVGDAVGRIVLVVTDGEGADDGSIDGATVTSCSIGDGVGLRPAGAHVGRAGIDCGGNGYIPS